MTTWVPGKPTHLRIEASVKCFDAQGYGFLTPSDGSPNVFCHISVVRGAGFETLDERATVICDIVTRPKNAAVTRIHAVDTAASPSLPSRNDTTPAPVEPASGQRRSGRRITAWIERIKPEVPGTRQQLSCRRRPRPGGSKRGAAEWASAQGGGPLAGQAPGIRILCLPIAMLVSKTSSMTETPFGPVRPDARTQIPRMTTAVISVVSGVFCATGKSHSRSRRAG